MSRRFLELAFTPSVLNAQRQAYGKARPFNDTPADAFGPDEMEFIAARDSFYLASVGESGWPYVQHRGGPKGFLRVLGPTTLAFADLSGNRQLVSTGNVQASERVALFLMDYPNRCRLKILGTARVESPTDNPVLLARVADANVASTVERIFVIELAAFDWNCPKYITPRFTAEEVQQAIEPLTRRIAELEAQLAARTNGVAPTAGSRLAK